VIVFTFTHGSHVGFYVGDEGEYVKTLGGNQDDTVKIKSYPKTAVVAYRLPPSTADASAGLGDPPH